MYEQRTPGESIASALPAEWHGLKLVITPWLVSCHELGRRIDFERSILLGLDPSIMTQPRSDITASATAVDGRHSTAELEEKLAQAYERHSVEVAAMQERFLCQQEELERCRNASASLAEEITGNLKGFLREELERQNRPIDTSNWVRQAVIDLRSDIESMRVALDRLSSSPGAQATAECARSARTCEHKGLRTLASKLTLSTSPGDQRAAEMAEVSTHESQPASSCPTGSPLTSSGGRVAMCSMLAYLFPTSPVKRRCSDSEEGIQAPLAKRRKSHPLWSRVFG